jgi:hypothetical protein
MPAESVNQTTGAPLGSQPLQWEGAATSRGQTVLGFAALTDESTPLIVAVPERAPQNSAPEEPTSTLAFRGEMPDLQNLLNQHRVAFAVIEAPVTMSRSSSRERQAWVFLCVLSVTWGIWTGLSLATTGRWLLPPLAAFAGCFGLAALVWTLRTWSKRQNHASRVPHGF